MRGLDFGASNHSPKIKEEDEILENQVWTIKSHVTNKLRYESYKWENTYT